MKDFNKCMNLNWNFQRVGERGGLKKNPLYGEGMVIFRNYTI